MKRLAALTVATLVLSATATAATAAPTDLVDFGSQTALHDCVTLALGTEQVTSAQLASLTTLTCTGGVSDISVLAGATSLTSLDLRYNSLTDLSPLSGLTELGFLSVNYQDVSLPATKPNLPFALPAVTGAPAITVQQGVIGDITDNSVTWAGPGYAALTWAGLVGYGSAGKQTTFSGSIHQIVMYQLNGAQAAITGTAQVGEPLTAVAGIGNANATFTYVWMADAVGIVGATSKVYTPGPAEVGKVISVEITVAQGGYFPFVSTSATTTAVIAGDPVPTPTEPALPAEEPTVTPAEIPVVVPGAVVSVPVALTAIHGSVPVVKGTAKVGKKLTVKPGTWDAGTAVSYRWYANGKAIAQAAKSTLTLTKALRHKRITVRVSGRKAGYPTVIMTSAATKKVK